MWTQRVRLISAVSLEHPGLTPLLIAESAVFESEANYWPKRLVNQSSVLGLDRAFFVFLTLDSCLSLGGAVVLDDD